MNHLATSRYFDNVILIELSSINADRLNMTVRKK